MQTMTLENPSAETVVLLEACNREGMLRIVAEGKQYLLRREAPSRGPMRDAPDFEARLREAWPKPLPASQVAEADKMIAGE